ncbi:hybrid sensor histidine kinase/response regulator [Paractinoplanes hotanensis]|uniref:histidine kinase n=1 Tax=Paractinoplanes hotanensis TaxID=2906497 RepID=A0ABT0XY87_9ACTN|nr:response regulator [Actinoplanes hotanensis]MCM4078560.1 response regulator [Actinoplanes hotanensis]
MGTVLVVDDHTTNRELVRDILTHRGHTVIEAHEGAEALGLAHAQHPDLVLTDVLMPGMDGYQLAQELRAAPDTAGTPIVFLTANYLPAEAQPVADACGVAKVLLKSVDPRTLLDAVDQAIATSTQTHREFDPEQAAHARQQAVDAKLIERTEALAETAARFQMMADHSPVGTVFGDEHGAANYINSRFTDIMGLSPDDLLGLGWLCCVDPDQHNKMLSVAGAGAQDHAQHRYRGEVTMPDGSARWLHVHMQGIPNNNGGSHGFIATIDDITTVVEAERQKQAADRKRYVDARIQATQRLEGLSRLAGGVAHDFNNILGAMLGFETFVTEGITELMNTGHIPSDAGRTLLSDLEQIRNGGHRATDLTQQLLTFGSRKHLSVAPLDLNQAIHESCDLLAPTIGKDIDVLTDLAVDLPHILAESVNIAQILLNLTMNACDAMESGGTLTISTSSTAIQGGEDGPCGGLPPGRYARLTIRDTGVGMTPDVLDRALEPFFTTKGRGKGTGLGLATTYGVINQLGGSLRIESAPHRGTTITIHLPTADETAEPPPAPTAQSAHGGTETVLLADDEEGIRETAARILTRAGYTVITAANGPDALNLASHHHGSIQLLLSDVVMPGMPGPELADLITTDRPTVNVLFMSGYADGLINDRGLLPPSATLLTKPFTASQLLAAVRASLETHRLA